MSGSSVVCPFVGWVVACFSLSLSSSVGCSLTPVGLFEICLACSVGWGVRYLLGCLGSRGNCICWFFLWLSGVGCRMLIVVPTNAISMTQVLLDLSHCGGWFVGAVLGLVFSVYWFVSHSSTTPLARSPVDTVLDFVNWSMLMPVIWYMALANSLFPQVMRSIKASRRACIHPHSVEVSSLRSWWGGSLLDVGLIWHRL